MDGWMDGWMDGRMDGVKKLKKCISSNFMKMRSAFIELLHEDGRTEINNGTKRCIF